MDDLLKTEFGKLLIRIEDEMVAALRDGYFDLKATRSDTFKALKKDPRKATDLARFIFENRHELVREVTGPGRLVHEYSGWRGFATFHGLMKMNLDLTPEELLQWISRVKSEPLKPVHAHGIDFAPGIGDWPIGPMIQMIEQKAKKVPLSKEAVQQLTRMLGWEEMGQAWNRDFAKIRSRIEDLIADAPGSEVPVVPYDDLPGDDFGDALDAEYRSLDPGTATKWTRLINHAIVANTPSPDKRFLDQTEKLKREFGHGWVRDLLVDWIGKAAASKPRGRPGRYAGETEYSDFTATNVYLMKGLVFMCDGESDARTVQAVSALCARVFAKAGLYDTEPSLDQVGNACLAYLEALPGPDVTACLRGLEGLKKNKGFEKKLAAILETRD